MKELSVLVVGGAGFIGSSLLRRMISLSVGKFWSLDNYISGSEENHVEGVRYVRGHSGDIKKLFKDISIDIIFHFGEFSRINASWSEIDTVMHSNLWGTSQVIDFAKERGAHLIYSASSAILGDKGNENMTPYTWTKAKMVELIKNYHSWFDLKYTIVYFYNVYGKGQIEEGGYATVMGIFEKAMKNGQHLPVVLPGTQSRIFTHIDDIVDGIILSAEKCENADVPIASSDEMTILELARSFGGNIEYLPERKGDRRKSSAPLRDILREDFNWKCNNNLNKYITDFLRNLKKGV